MLWWADASFSVLCSGGRTGEAPATETRRRAALWWVCCKGDPLPKGSSAQSLTGHLALVTP